MRLKENEGRGGVNVIFDNLFYFVYGIKIFDMFSVEVNFVFVC